MSGTESEAKVRLADVDDFREKLKAAGASLVRPLTEESNQLYDQSGELSDSGRLLRLRRYGDEAILTFKGPSMVVDGVRSRPEWETCVTEGPATEQILLGLGYRPTLRYEKKREVWRLGELEIVVDLTPMGWFCEFEGSIADVDRVATEFGFPIEARLGCSYATLWVEWRQSHPEAPIDMVFP